MYIAQNNFIQYILENGTFDNYSKKYFFVIQTANYLYEYKTCFTLVSSKTDFFLKRIWKCHLAYEM